MVTRESIIRSSALFAEVENVESEREWVLAVSSFGLNEKVVKSFPEFRIREEDTVGSHFIIDLGTSLHVDFSFETDAGVKHDVQRPAFTSRADAIFESRSRCLRKVAPIILNNSISKFFFTASNDVSIP